MNQKDKLETARRRFLADPGNPAASVEFAIECNRHFFHDHSIDHKKDFELATVFLKKQDFIVKKISEVLNKILESDLTSVLELLPPDVVTSLTTQLPMLQGLLSNFDSAKEFVSNISRYEANIKRMIPVQQRDNIGCYVIEYVFENQNAAYNIEVEALCYFRKAGDAEWDIPFCSVLNGKLPIDIPETFNLSSPKQKKRLYTALDVFTLIFHFLDEKTLDRIFSDVRILDQVMSIGQAFQGEMDYTAVAPRPTMAPMPGRMAVRLLDGTIVTENIPMYPEEPPEGAVVGYLNNNDEFQELGPMTVAMPSPFPTVGATGLVGRDPDGNFHDLIPGQQLPLGSVIGMRNDSGDFVHLSSSPLDSPLE